MVTKSISYPEHILSNNIVWWYIAVIHKVVAVVHKTVEGYIQILGKLGKRQNKDTQNVHWSLACLR